MIGILTGETPPDTQPVPVQSPDAVAPSVTVALPPLTDNELLE